MIRTASEALEIAEKYFAERFPNYSSLGTLWTSVAFDGRFFLVRCYYGQDRNRNPFCIKVDAEGSVVGWSLDPDHQPV